MLTLHPQYITDINGLKLSVVLPMTDFKAILEQLEELEDVKLYDEAQLKDETSLPIDEAFSIIEANRNKG